MIDFTDPAVARRWKRRSVTAISISAAAGITWYAVAPGVASYQVGYTLALPALITAAVWIGKRLPRWLDWVIAIALGAGGAAAYVLVGEAGLLGDRFEGVQQDGLADAAQSGDHHALLGPREPETSEQYAEGLDLLVAAGQGRRAGASARRVGVTDRVDSVEFRELYGV